MFHHVKSQRWLFLETRHWCICLSTHFTYFARERNPTKECEDLFVGLSGVLGCTVRYYCRLRYSHALAVASSCRTALKNKRIQN